MSSRTIVSRVIGSIILGTGIWCLYLSVISASFAFSNYGINGMPLDMRLAAVVSSAVALFFSYLFLFGGASSVLRNKVVQLNYYPTLLNLATLLILIVMSILARAEYEPTTKMSWEESRGFPFAFLTFTEIRGVCSSGIAFWECRFFDNLNLPALIIDVLLIYAVACVTMQILSELRTANSIKWLLTDRSDV